MADKLYSDNAPIIESEEKPITAKCTNDDPLVAYAKDELKILIDSDDSYDNLMAASVIELIQTFSNQGHSGFSAPWCIKIFSRLANFKPLDPLTGEDDEWNQIREDLYQNKRYSSVFKDADGKAYDIDARVISNDGGETWYTNRDSRVFIEFPYVVPDFPEKVLIKQEEKKDE